MGKINGCLKGLFISFNALLAILGCLLIFVALKSNTISHQLSEVVSPVWIWVFAISILSISYLGIHAGLSESEIILKIFAGFMGVGMIIMLIFGIVTVVRRNQFESSIDSTASFMKNMDHCCGVVSASDWGDNIPDSCQCSGSRCKSSPHGVRGPDRVYKQPCIEIVLGLIDRYFKLTMGMFFGFAVTALMGLLFSLLMVREVQHHNSFRGSSFALKGY